MTLSRAVSAPYSELLRIADSATTADRRTMAMRSFAQELDWIPSYEVPGTFGLNAIAGHLIVEHGLENAAAISFLKSPARSADLQADQLKSLLAVSYNNLIEWHLIVSINDARCVNNLADRTTTPAADRAIQISPESLSSTISFGGLRRSNQDNLISRPIRPCDEALIRTITRWKSLLKADYRSISNSNLSSLFNSLIFVRGCEDRNFNQAPGSTRILLNALATTSDTAVDVVSVLEQSLIGLGIETRLSEFVDVEALEPFRSLHVATTYDLFHDLYSPRDAGYELNFALMSKHALSRIY